MSRVNQALVAFNRGIVSPLALARTDVTRIGLSAEIQKNWIPRSLGSMMLRPGLEFIGSTKSNAKARWIPFVFAADDTALIELTNLVMRIWVNDVVLSRVAVSATITNGNFTTDLSSWTDADEAGAASTWGGANTMILKGTGYNAAIRYQLVTLGGGDSGKLHALNVVISGGHVMLRVGSTIGGQEYLSDQELLEGQHSITFTPTGNFYVQFSSRTSYNSYVNSVAIDGSGDVEITTTWATADLENIRYEQSGDVVFVACRGEVQRRIERRDNGSWSYVIYSPEDGPWRAENTEPIFLEPSATTGDVTITASRDVFGSGQTSVRSLFRIRSVGQVVTASIAGEEQYTDSILVTGFEDERIFNVTITGVWAGTVTLQRSIGVPDAWVDANDWTANTDTDIDDDLDDQSVYYRVGILTGDYTSGTAVVTLTFERGSITGIVQVTGVSSTVSAGVRVLKPLGGTIGSQVWSESAWSDRRGWPSAVSLFEGRLWWAGMDRLWGSVSDAFASYDDTIEGDSGPISRSIGAGPVETIQWLLPLQRLIAGGQAAEFSIRSSSFDEPLTPTNFSIKPASTQGSTGIQAVRVDATGVFVQRGTARVYILDFRDDYYDYSATDLTTLCPELCAAGVVAMSVQRQPDTRVHCILADGTVAINIYDKAENVRCWITVEMTTHDITDVVVLPAEAMEDTVYYEAKISSNHYLLKWAPESSCQGGQLNKQADFFVDYTGGAISSLTGLDHLNGQTVVIWADGIDRGTAVVSGGAAALGGSYTNVVAGLGYTAQYKSTKLAYGEELGSALTQRKRVSQLGVMLRNTHYQGLKYGPDFSTLDDLPLVHEAATTTANTIHTDFDSDPFEFPGEWGTDPRLCLQAAAPRPCTILGVVLVMDTEEGFHQRKRSTLDEAA